MSETIYSVGIDAGFASTVGVVYSFDPKKRDGDLVGVATKLGARVIPSRLTQGANQSTSVLDENLHSTYEVNGLFFTVDPELPNESTRNPKLYHFAEPQCVLNQHMMQLLQLSGKKNVRLATGLPISLYYRNNDINTDNTKRKINALMSTVVTPKYETEAVRPISVEVRAEGVGAYFDRIIDDQGRLDHSNKEKRIAIIDVGGETTDIVTISKLSVIDHLRTASANIGVLDVLQEIRKGLAEIGIDEPLEYRLEKMLHEQKYVYKNKELSHNQVLEILSKAIRTVFFRLQNFVTEKLGDANDINHILIVGGGGVVFGDELKEIYEQAEVVDQPQYANASGFAKLGLYNIRREISR